MLRLFEKLDAVFRAIIGAFVAIILGALTFKTIDNFFFGGEPVSFAGGTVGFQNSDTQVFAQWFSAPHGMGADRIACTTTILEEFEQAGFLTEGGLSSDWVYGNTGADLVVAVCDSDKLRVVSTSADKSRALVNLARVSKLLETRFAPDETSK